MTNYKMIVSYHGGNYFGWQRQTAGPSVQAEIEKILSLLEKNPVTIHAAGRTDSGVHALAQVISFHLNRDITPQKLLLAVNFHLRYQKIAITHCATMPDDFHARFSAVKRYYRYRILNRIAPPILERGLVWHIPIPLNIQAMAEGARFFIGNHDFTSFRASHCQAKSPIKTLDEAEIKMVNEEIHCDFSARSFLHHQVRNMVGSLVAIGKGQFPPDHIKKTLAEKDRTKADITAPSEGLCLMKVDY